MASYEEIFDAIEKERVENERIKRESIRKKEEIKEKYDSIKRKVDIADRFIYGNISKIYAKKEAEKFIKENNLIEKIFNDFLEQVKIGKKILSFGQTFNFYHVTCEEEFINKALMKVLQAELPSYDIVIKWDYGNEDTEMVLGYEQGRKTILEDYSNKKIFLEVIAHKPKNATNKNNLKQYEETCDEKIPFVKIENYDDDLRKYVANSITYFLDHIPEYDEDVINMLKEKELLIKYQPLIHGARGEKSQNLEITICLLYNIDDGVVSEIKHYFLEKDNGILLHREYEYYQENGKHYFKITREALEPLKNMN